MRKIKINESILDYLDLKKKTQVLTELSKEEIIERYEKGKAELIGVCIGLLCVCVILFVILMQAMSELQKYDMTLRIFGV